MKGIAKCYPKKEISIEELVRQTKIKGLDGLMLPLMTDNKANFQSQNFDFSGFSLTELGRALRREGIQLGLVAPFFYDPLVWDKYPEKRAKIDGKDWPSDSWYKPLCPIYPGLFEERLALLEEAVDKINPDFVGLDFFRFPIFWEQIKGEEILKLSSLSCRCSNCSASENRISIITEMAKTVKERFSTIDIIIHLVPFVDDDYIKVTGQNPLLLNEILDAIAPMLYNNLLQRDSNFVIKTLEKLKFAKVWPSLESKWFYELDKLPKRYEKVLYFHFDTL